jgi:hypothetical protein
MLSNVRLSTTTIVRLILTNVSARGCPIQETQLGGQSRQANILYGSRSSMVSRSSSRVHTAGGKRNGAGSRHQLPHYRSSPRTHQIEIGCSQDRGPTARSLNRSHRQRVANTSALGAQGLREAGGIGCCGQATARSAVMSKRRQERAAAVGRVVASTGVWDAIVRRSGSGEDRKDLICGKSGRDLHKH